MIGGLPVATMARFGSSTGMRLSATSVSQLRIHVADRAEVGRAGPRVQFAEERVVADLALQFRDPARRIVQVAEHDGVGRTRLLTRGLNLALANTTVLVLALDPRVTYWPSRLEETSPLGLTVQQLAGAYSQIIQFGLPEDYFNTFTQKAMSLTPESANAIAKKFILPDHLIWVVVGDMSKVEAGIRELNLGEVHKIDVDGNPVQ